MTNPQDDSRDFVTFAIESQWFAVPVADIQDVFTLRDLARVPLAPPEIAGVLNLRGRIITAIDLRRRLGVAPRGSEDPAMAVGVECAGEHYGLIVDRAGEVLRLSASEVHDNPAGLDPVWKAVSRGVCRVDGRLLVLLDTLAVLPGTAPAQAA